MPGRIDPCSVAPALDQPTDGGRLILPDRTTAQLRAATPEDEDALYGFFERLSPESRRRRFFSAALPRPELLASLCKQKDPHCGSTLLVIHTGQGEPRIIATGSYLAKDEQSAEVAFAVDDAFQGKGLGTLLLKRLAAQAVRNGFTRFWAITQADNLAMRDVFRDSGFAVEERQEGNEVEVSLSIAPGKKPWAA